MLRLDDDDGNPNTRSPNHCLINTAFAKHGLAENENCQDEAEQRPPVNTDIFIALIDDRIYVSDIHASNIVVCNGDVSACLNSQNQDFTFSLDGQKNGRRVFISEQIFTPQEQSVLTILTKNHDDEITGYRSVKITKK